MTGIEILATEEVVTAYAFNWTSFWIAIFISLVLFITAGIIISIYNKDVTPFIILTLFGSVVGIMFGSMAGSSTQIPMEYETRYKVTISDEIFVTDLFELYDVISQEGKIYTVRERK